MKLRYLFHVVFSFPPLHLSLVDSDWTWTQLHPLGHLAPLFGCIQFPNQLSKNCSLSFQSSQQPNPPWPQLWDEYIWVWANFILSSLCDSFSSAFIIGFLFIYFFTLILRLFSQTQRHSCFWPPDIDSSALFFHHWDSYSLWLQCWCCSAQFVLLKVQMWVHGKVFAVTLVL